MKDIIIARLSQLGVSAYLVSVRSGRRPSWLSDFLAASSPRLASVQQVAGALGLRPSDLMDGTPPASWPPPPAWLADARARKGAAEDQSLPACPECGRRRRLVARGLCAACYQRLRRAWMAS